jgi:single-stranded-DNA-specific exonuclease
LSEFLHPEISDLNDPFLLKDMATLVAILKEAKENKAKIYIYGDYDVDGITSISILYNYLKSQGYNINYYIPNRFDEGYGVNCHALDTIKAAGGSLVVTVDCGITSVEEAKHAQAIGLPLFITDHHECQEVLPECLGIINPKQSDCQYPYDMLVGAGIALKIVQALSGETFNNIYPEYMEIAAIGTIADVGPLTGENRIIAKYGLKALEVTKNIGLKALLKEVDLLDKELNSGHIGFGLGPRLNAAGRVDSAELGVKLLTTDRLHEAESIAEELNDLNKQRQDMEQGIIDACIEQVETSAIKNDLVLVLNGDKWHTGVIGIVASRISERYYKPTIILSSEEGMAKGSARSVGDFNIFEAMYHSKDLFSKFGGHKAAAGVSMPADHVEVFRQQINSYAREHMETKDFYPKIAIDATVSSEDVAHDFAETLEGLKPFGLGNPKPSFLYKNLEVDTVRWLGKNQQHLKLSVHDGARVYECIKFNGSDDERKIRTGDRVDLVFTLEINKFRGVETLQFALKDIFVKNRISQEFEEAYFVSFIDYLSEIDPQEMKGYSNGQAIEVLFDHLDHHIQNNESFLITVGSIEGLRELEQYFIDASFESYGWQFSNVMDLNKQVVVYPRKKDLAALNCKYYYGLDLLLEDGRSTSYVTKNQRTAYKVYKEKLTVQLSVFKFLYKELAKLKTVQSLKSLGEEMKLAPYVIYLAAKIFEEKGLMDISYKEGNLGIDKVHKPSQKVDLMSSKIIRCIEGL